METFIIVILVLVGLLLLVGCCTCLIFYAVMWYFGFQSTEGCVAPTVFLCCPILAPCFGWNEAKRTIVNWFNKNEEITSITEEV